MRGAIADYDKALGIDPYFAPAYNGRGLAKRPLGRYEEAIADYTHALGIDPNYARAYCNRGYAKDELGQYETRHRRPIPTPSISTPTTSLPTPIEPLQRTD